MTQNNPKRGIIPLIFAYFLITIFVNVDFPFSVKNDYDQNWKNEAY
jgi:hypothetical protein